jgi:hypothetical protein
MADWFKGKLAIATVLVSAMMGSTSTRALSPASPEQLLCNSSYVFLGRAVSASNRDVGKDPKSFARYDTRNTVELSILVKEVMGTTGPLSKSPPGPVLSPGDTIEAVTTAETLPWSMLPHGSNGHLYFTAPLDAILPNDLIRSAYTAEDFIFSALTPSPGRRHLVLVWPADKRDWALQTMARAQANAARDSSGSWDCPSVHTRERASR